MKIGFIGLGTMGRGMASNLQKAGHELIITDLSRDAVADHLAAGAVWADTPREVAAASDIVFTSLPTPADVEAVGTGKDGLAEGFRPGSVWFDLTTNDVDLVRRLNTQMAEIGVAFLDAPVSGGPAGAASGRMAIWVGGDKEVFDRCKSVLDAMGDQVRYIGAIGAGSIAKLSHNLASTVMNAVLAEVFTMADKAGLDPLSLWTAIRDGAAGKLRAFDLGSNRYLPGKFDPPSFALRLVYKDISLALKIGRDNHVPMRLCNIVLQDIAEGLNRGWGGRDSQSYLALQNERAGVDQFAIPYEKILEIRDGKK